jgi:hypothetical protein
MNQEKYIGMDVHEATISAAVKNAQDLAFPSVSFGVIIRPNCAQAIAALTGGERQRPIIRSITHAPDQTHRRPQLLH